MRPRLIALLIAGLVIGGSGLGAAAPYGSFEKRLEQDFLRNSHTFTPAPRKERTPEEIKFQPTYGDALGTKLGVVNGKARFFRYNLDDSSKSGRAIEGAFDGNGVKFRLTW